MTDLRQLWAKWWGVPGLALVFVAYSHSFNTFPILERQHSVLAEADAAPFAILLRDFALARKIGNEYNTVGRSNRDIAQKHKTHHLLYAMVGTGVYHALRGVYAITGRDPDQALYGVNAVIACANLVLLFLLLKHLSPLGSPRPVYLAWFAVSLGTWIYSSIPESWPFSTTLVLGFLLLWFTRRPHYLWMSAYIGAAMLNNFLLGSLGVFVFLRRLRERRPLMAVGEGALALVVILAVWSGSLTALSVFDDSLRPDHYIAYSVWFKDFTDAGLPLTDPYVWKSAISNLFITAVTSHQPDPIVPQEALLTTITGSRLGLAAVVAYLAVMGVALWSAGKQLAAARRVDLQGWARGLLADDGLHLVVYCAVFAVLVVITFFGGGFLYSCITVPLLILFAARYVEAGQPRQRWLVVAALTIVAVNNTLQILEFREALRAIP